MPDAEITSVPGLPPAAGSVPEPQKQYPEIIRPTGKTLFTPDNIVTPHDQWAIEVSYEWDSGTEQMGVAGSASITGNRQPSKIVQVASPKGKLVITWIAKRRGVKPKYPSPVTKNPNLTLKTAVISPCGPALETNGRSHEYVASGVYTYWMTVPVWVPTDKPTMGATVYDTTPASQNVITPDDFVEGLF